MSKYTIDSSTLTNIADAIREKTGGSSQITPLEMPAEIANISGGSGAPPIPAFTKTLIATTDVDNAPNNLVFTGDYTTQDFLEISMQNTSSLETNKFITSPEIITHSFTVSNDRYSINEADTNQYGCYILQQGGDWRRNTNRNLLIKEIYGWNCNNYDITKTDFYKRDPYGGSNVIVNAPAGDSFYNYDFLFIATSTGDYDDAGDNPLIYPIRTDFGTDYKIGLGINQYYSLGGYVLSNNTLSEGPYLYVQGIKFNFGRAIAYSDFTESVFKALNKQRNDRDNTLSGIVYYPSDNSYFPIIADGQPKIAFKFTGTYSGGFKIRAIDYNCYYGYWYTIDDIERQTSGISVEGFEYPRVATVREANPTAVSRKSVDISTFEASNHPLYSSPSQIYNLYTSGTHPVALNAWGDNQVATLKDITDSQIDITDLFYIDRVPNNFNLDNITQGCIFISENYLVIDCGPDDGPRVYVDSEGITHSRAGTARHFWGGHNGFPTNYLDAISNIQLYDNSAGDIGYADNNPAENIVFSTYDLGNGYNANISLEKFKSIFHVS